MNFELTKMKEVGSLLFKSVLNGPVRDLFFDCRYDAKEREVGLRLLLSLDDSISTLPWELLYAENEFIALNSQTPIVRYEAASRPLLPLHAKPPLRLLVVIANPGVETDVAHEQRAFLAALQSFLPVQIEVTFIEGLDALQQVQQTQARNQAHVLHFVGPVLLDQEGQESARGQSVRLGSVGLQSLLQVTPGLQMLVLGNTALGWRAETQVNLARELLNSGAPCSVVVPYRIGEDATQIFLRNFYGLLAFDAPADVALTEARKMIFARGADKLEWAAPILSTQIPDCRLFDFGCEANLASEKQFTNFEIAVRKTKDNEYAVQAKCGERMAETRFVDPFDEEMRRQIMTTMAFAPVDWTKVPIKSADPRSKGLPPVIEPRALGPTIPAASKDDLWKVKIGKSREPEQSSGLLNPPLFPKPPPSPASVASPTPPPPPASVPSPTVETSESAGNQPGDYSLEKWVSGMYRNGLTEMERGDWPRAINAFEEVLRVMKARRSSGYRDAEDLLAICRRNLTASQPKPPYLDENVQFTVYKPKKIRPAVWYDMLAYAHLSEARPGSDERDPVEQMKDEARRILGEVKILDYSPANEASSQAVPQMGEIMFVPFMPGVDFNPRSSSFLWEESVHGEKFRMRATAVLNGKTARGRLSVFLGSILLAEINLSIQVDSVLAPAADRAEPVPEEPARPFRNIFPSYSHDDIDIVAQIEQYAQLTGDKYLRDVNQLRSGQDWKRWMRETVAQADIFQLFWSTHSMRSENVRLEWEHALSLRRPDFVRPTYWEDPFPELAEENLPPPELKDLYFQPLRILTKAVAAEPPQRDRMAASRESDRRTSLQPEAGELKGRVRNVFGLKEQWEAEERQKAEEEERRRVEQARSKPRNIAPREDRAPQITLPTMIETGEENVLEVFWAKRERPKPWGVKAGEPEVGCSGPLAIAIGLGIGIAILGVLVLVLVFVMRSR